MIAAILRTTCVVVVTLVAALSPTARGAAAASGTGSSVRTADDRASRLLQGEQAIRSAGGDLATVAARNGMSAARVRHTLLTDPSAWLDRDGLISFVEPTRPGGRTVDQDDPGFPLADTFELHSRPSSTHTIFLDFRSREVSSTVWNATHGLPDRSYRGYSLDEDLDGFAEVELQQIQSIWRRVAEDYAPLDVDVTTADPGPSGIERTSASDDVFGTVVFISNDSDASGRICSDACGGVASVGSFDTYPLHSFRQPAWVFGHLLGSNDTKAIAEAVSHEAGHTLGLSHDGRSSPAETYYAGHDMWAPIMGVGYDRPLVQWSRGEYDDASNPEDDLAVMAGNGAPPIADEAPSGIIGAGALPVSNAYITSATDLDTYALGECSGPVMLTASGAETSPDLDIRMALLDSAGGTVLSNNPASTYVDRDSVSGTDASITTEVTPGTYFVRIDGVGNGTGGSGYTDYASLGAYAITATGCVGPSPPSAPAGLTASSTSAGTSVALTWSRPVSDGGSPVTGYRVSRTDSADPSSPVTVDVNKPAHTWTGLRPGRTYTFSVRATNGIGHGLEATQTSTVPAVLPSAPTSLQATSTFDGSSATLTWSAPSESGGSAITGYTLTRTDPDEVVEPVNVGPVDHFTWGGLHPGTVYTFTVRAINAVGAGMAASRTEFMPATTPSAPNDLDLSPASDGTSATLTWSTPDSSGGSNVIDYMVSRTVGEAAEGVTTTARSVRTPLGITAVAGSHTWTKLTPGATYTFSVAARNAAGTGPAASLSVTMPRRATKPGTPTIRKVIGGDPGGRSSATVRWIPPRDNGRSAATSYRVIAIEMLMGKTGRVRSFTTSRPGVTSYVARLPRGKYRFAVRAINKHGIGHRSPLSRAVIAR